MSERDGKSCTCQRANSIAKISRDGWLRNSERGGQKNMN